MSTSPAAGSAPATAASGGRDGSIAAAASAANAALEHMRDWAAGTAPGDWTSMAVRSDGSYGIEEGLIYSFPVQCEGGDYKIVQGLPVDDFSRQKMQATENELKEERDSILKLVS
jgi:malate dehydrogenase